MEKYKTPTLALAAVICLVSLMALSQPVNKSLSKQIIGEWRNVYIKMIIHHQGKPTATMEADSSNWEARLGIRPIRTHFKEDGTYYSEYITLKDSVARRPTGTWNIKGDSITITQLTPDKSSYTLQLKINNNRATFTGKIDFDGEGITNDEYYGIQKKFQ